MARGLTIVIKLGTSSIVDEITHEPILSILSLIVETVVSLRRDGHRVVLVSSGAIGVGLQRMNIDKRPKHLPKVQALAAIGQCRLMTLWDQLFTYRNQPVAQVLLTRNDIADRAMYVNAQNTFTELLGMGVIPIVNENDTVAVSEIKFGDNDTLSAITAGMVHADYLFLMTDVDCLYDKNPRKFPEAVPIRVVEEIQQLEADVTSKGSALGTGGMSTKIDAARLGTAAGVTTIITSSSKPGNVAQIVKALQKQRLAAEADFAAMKLHASETSNQMHTPSYAVTKVQDHPDRPAGDAELDSQEPPTQPPITPHMKEMLTRQINNTDPADCPLHTCFLPEPNPIRSRDFWIQAGLKPHGTVYIDEGAHRALIDKAGLLPSGIIAIKGKFHQQEAVRIAVVKGTTNLEEFSHFVDDAEDKLAGLGTKHRSKISDGLATGNRSGARTPPTPPEVREVGRALVNYSAPQISRIKGLKSAEILGALGYSDSEYVAQRENISLFPDGKGATDGHME